MWNLWLDDQCRELLDENVPGVFVRPIPRGYIGCASTDEAIAMVEELGPPEFMDLDHDLGGDDNAMKFLRWLSDNHFHSIPDYCVHSRNPVGKENIISFMDTWERIYSSGN